jgi:hypothetical protein
MTIEGAKLRGLQSVRVSKKFLLDKLTANRAEHEKTYYEILDARHQKVVEGNIYNDFRLLYTTKVRKELHGSRNKKPRGTAL